MWKIGFLRTSINKQLVFMGILIIIITESILCLGTYYGMKRVVIRNSAGQAVESVNQLADKLNERLKFTLDQFNYLEIDQDVVAIAQGTSGNDDISDFMWMSRKFGEERLQNVKVIESIVFIRRDGKVFYESPVNRLAEADYTQMDWYQACLKNNGQILWYRPYDQELFVNKNNQVIGILKEITNSQLERLGVLAINLRQEYLENELNGLNLGPGTELFITNGQTAMTQTAPEFFAETMQFVNAQQYNSPETVEIGGKKQVITCGEIPINGWQVIGVVPQENLFQDNIILITSMLTAVFGGLVLTALIIVFTIKKITTPINKLRFVMLQVENGQVDARFQGRDLARQDEIGILANKFNDMLDSVERLMQAVETESKKKAKAELRALQQQINSHFLYNTLDSIYIKIMRGDKEKSLDMVQRLARYFRLALNQGSDITTVEKEIAHIENYVAIEKYRYSQPFQCVIQVDKSIYDFEIPKLLLQPLVENSIVHGIFRSKEEGRIVVTGTQLGDKIIFRVMDNGGGFDAAQITRYVQDEVKQDAFKKSFALRNIRTRIQLFYQGQGDIFFYNNGDGGACVEIVLPVRRIE